MLLQQSIEYVSIVYTCNACNALVLVFYSGISGQCSHTILGLTLRVNHWLRTQAHICIAGLFVLVCQVHLDSCINVSNAS